MTDPETAARILVVDDDKSAIELVANTFGNEYEVLFALDGETALRLAAAMVPDLILLDVLLPGLDGFEVRRRLRADPLTRNIPTIFVTALGDTAAEAKGLALGAVDYITKPLNPPLVALRVRNQIELKRTRDQLARQAFVDGLTGLANRRHFDESLTIEYARHVRAEVPLAMLMLDIDHFKLFNDHYGHVQGDDCLRAIAGVLTEELYRGPDLAARYGGEEFVCILPETRESAGVREVAERILQRVAELGIPHAASPTAARVTVSIGGVLLRCQRDGSPLEIVAAADVQLYEAKRAGRNRCHVATRLG